MFVVEQTMSLINSLAHLIGSRPFPTRGEHSGNIAILALPTWGEAWHNNHHAFPWSAAFGLRWWQFDPGYWAIALLAKLGLAWDVKTPARDLVQSRLFDAAGGP